ncbi:hypothetical protein Lalb_Chr23g0274841 [Lupinus albus]|uniref:Reverse transcriptase zinc-binding domain-containing protein n=1 Tax=Lupinus albus TaxID=3870 RepID=A0A6A4NDL8_LUPAL|nr:hypothetical protein Lalb_Chr23g0274841 [Lupinus albus]
MFQKKMRFMRWLVIHDSLPINVLRFICKLVSSTVCCWCNGFDEDLLHTLRDISNTILSWLYLSFNLLIPFHGVTSLLSTSWYVTLNSPMADGPC